MKNIFTALLLFLGYVTQGQAIIIDYDNAGNRILRKSSGALPVTLISFHAVKEEHTALFTWQTASEINSDRFDIERSQDGKKWLNIGAVKANGDKISSSYYSFIDKTPADGANLYRLKMVDSDGTFTFTRIQSVYFDAVISFYPNPVKDRLKITEPDSGSIQILNNAGKVVYNSNSIAVDGIEMEGLATGVYLVRITRIDGSLIIRKIVKR